METFPWGRMPSIRIYNSMTRREETFPPVHEHPEVSIYVCGPTTYQLVHVGNMRNPVLYDVIRKVFRAHGYRVKFVTNFTDIDDKIIAEARKIGEADPIQLSARFVHEYYTDLFSLGVEPADFFPKVSCHIGDIVDYVKLIMDKGHAYVGTDGSVYFDVSSYPGYLKLSGLSMQSLLENVSQGEELEAKRDPRDFALWKAAKPGEPVWDFPQTPEEASRHGKVSAGRPGWHIECSVMSAKYLGPSFDIHGGGKELRFPHHENELAQAKCGHPEADFARIWIHNEWVTLPGGEKMAKSGESVLVRDVLRENHPDVVRMFLLSAHYRKEVEFSKEKLEIQARARERIVEAFRRVSAQLRWRAEEREENWLNLWRQVDRGRAEWVEDFLLKLHQGLRVDDFEIEEPGWYLVNACREALFLAHRHLADDFDTQGAMGELFKLVGRINSSLDRMAGSSADFSAFNIALGALVHLTNIFGILRSERASLYATEEERELREKGSGDASKLAEVLLALREDARAGKNYALADKIRDKLAQIGAEVRDTEKGPVIYWK